MKAISLWQPWGTLIAIGAKKIETRSWGTPYRGLLAIHAAQTWNRELIGICYQPHFAQALAAAGYVAHAAPVCPSVPVEDGDTSLLPLGAIVCVVRLAACAPIDRYQPTDQERAFGDYRAGRFGWSLQDVVALARPIPFSGKQGFFEVPDHLLEGVQCIG